MRFEREDIIKATKKFGRVLIITGKVTDTFYNGYEITDPAGLKRYVTHEHYFIEPYDGR